MNHQTLPPEYQLLLSCTKKNITTGVEIQIKSLASSQLDWSKLVNHAVRHNLSPLLYTNLKKHAKELVPTNIYYSLEKKFIATAKTNLLFAAELINLVTLLQNNGITVIPFKGPVLEALAYGDVAPRSFCDLDIYVPKEQFLQAKQILLTNKYQPTYSNLANANFTLLTKHCRHDNFTKDGLSLEVHWRIESIEARFREQQVLSALYSQTINIDLHGFSIPCFTIENLIIFLVLHCSNHRWESLSQLCDIAFLIEKYPDTDWSKIVNIATKLQIKKILGTTFSLISTLFDIKLPQEIQNLISHTPSVTKFAIFIQKTSLFTNTPLNFINKSLCLIRQTDSLWQGLNNFLYVAFNPTGKELTTINLPQHLSFLYFIIRPLLLMRPIWDAVTTKFSARTS